MVVGCFFCSSRSTSRDVSLDTPFHLPSPLPSWPTGGNFAKGVVDLGGLEVTQISTFSEVWSTKQGGPSNAGASFYKPSPIPPSYSLLGYYAQSNYKPLYGWSLVARVVNDTTILVEPLDYMLLDSLSDSSGVDRGYFWFPIAPEGYHPVGVVVTTSSDKPSTDEVRCVRADFVSECENDAWIWGDGGSGVYELRPKDRGVHAMGVRVGSFVIGTPPPTSPPLACMNNLAWNYSSMPNLEQIHALAHSYSPVFYFHPDEPYLPSSVNWNFANGALLYMQGNPTPIKIDPEGANLPQGGTNDGTFWIDLPLDDSARSVVKQGNLESAIGYIHVKPMLGATFTDLAVWLFYPFNGGAKAKVGFIKSISLGRIGEHVGDWEHVTLRISNFSGELWRVYLSQHSSGTWLDASELEFESRLNQPVVYASLNGHANYAHPGLILQGNEKLGIGIRNDMAKAGPRFDVANRFEVVAADHLEAMVAPRPWLDYYREWGPKITYDIGKDVDKVLKYIPGPLKKQLKRVIDGLPSEVFSQEGPTGPKEKGNWAGDEK